MLARRINHLQDLARRERSWREERMARVVDLIEFGAMAALVLGCVWLAYAAWTGRLDAVGRMIFGMVG